MQKLRNLTAAAIVLASLAAAPALARDFAVTRSAGLRHIPHGGPARTVWHYDGRDDTRDFPTTGFFPGDFAADPANAAIGAAGIFGSTPSRALNGYPRKSSLDHSGLRAIALDAIIFTTEHPALSLKITTRAIGADNVSFIENVTGAIRARAPRRPTLVRSRHPEGP